MILVIILLVIGVISAVIYFSTKAWEVRVAAWQSAADELGLEYSQNGRLNAGADTISGTLDDVAVSVSIVSHGSGNQRQTYTCYSAWLPKAVGFDLSITQAGAFSGLSKFFGSQDVTIGDSWFDEKVIIKTNDPEAARAFLTEDRKEHILKFIDRFTRPQVTSSSIEGYSTGVDRDFDKLVMCIQLVATYARLLCAETLPELEQLFEELDESDLELVPTLESHDLFDVDSGEEISRIPPAVASTPHTGPSAVLVCRQVFDVGIRLAESNKRFDEFAEQGISWNGTLVDVQRYSFDSVFGNVPGTRATFGLDVQKEAGLTSKVRAVLQLPELECDVLAVRKGQTMIFSGTLQKVESLLSEIYVRDGQILS